MESIFKVGDKVYDYQFGWGEVIRIKNNNNFVVEVEFQDFRREVFTRTGYYSELDLHPTLSFTEYTLQGFSQERPFDPQDCVGKWCKLSDKTSRLHGMVFDKVCCIEDGFYVDRDGINWENAEILSEEQLQAFNLTND